MTSFSTVELRPRGISEVIGLSFDLYRRNFPLFVGIAAVVVVPTMLLLSISQFASLAVFAANPALFGAGDVEAASDSLAGSMVMASLGSTCVGLLVYVAGAFWPWMEGALSHNVIERVLGRAPGLRESYRETRLRFGALWGSNALAQLGIGALFYVALVVGAIAAGIASGVAASASASSDDGGAVFASVLALLCAPVLLAGVILAVVLAINWTFRAPVIVGEGVDGVRALSRSNELASGQRWRIFGRYLLFGLLVNLIIFIPTVVLLAIVLVATVPALSAGVGSASVEQGFVPLVTAVSVIALAVGFIAALLLTPLSAIFTTVNYLDLRTRKENLAALVMNTSAAVVPAEGTLAPTMASMGASAPPPPLVPATAAPSMGAASPTAPAPTPALVPPATASPSMPSAAQPPADTKSMPPGQRIGVLFNRLRTEGDSPAVLNELGMAYMEIGDLSGALDALSRARVLAPADADIAFNLAMIYRDRKELRLARQMMGEYLRLETNADELTLVRSNPRYKDLIE